MTNAGAVSAGRPAALITGASAGIGAEFARQLADRMYDLILVARRRDRLEELSAQIRALHGIRVEIITADLASPDAPATIAADVARLGMQVDMLVNNAGFGTHGRFESLDGARERDEITVNVGALVALTHAFLPGMLERKRGGVINVASTASFQPVTYMAVYGATKAFVRSFSAALREEVRGRGVRVLALCPGPTATEFFDKGVAVVPGPMRTSHDVVKTALTAFDAGKAVVVDGALNKIMSVLVSPIPASLTARISGMLLHPRG
jgi:short-subunit dehydrogenase